MKKKAVLLVLTLVFALNAFSLSALAVGTKGKPADPAAESIEVSSVPAAETEVVAETEAVEAEAAAVDTKAAAAAVTAPAPTPEAVTPPAGTTSATGEQATGSATTPADGTVSGSDAPVPPGNEPTTAVPGETAPVDPNAPAAEPPVQEEPFFFVEFFPEEDDEFGTLFVSKNAAGEWELTDQALHSSYLFYILMIVLLILVALVLILVVDLIIIKIYRAQR